MTPPIHFHYGSHTKIGDNFFFHFHLVIQDDVQVKIGNNCFFGPNVTIVTPIHPLIASERKAMKTDDGRIGTLCYAKPVIIENDVWLCANVTIIGGVTIGEGSVIGAGSVVTKSIPPFTFAAGNPCKVIRAITEKDSMKYKEELLDGYSL